MFVVTLIDATPPLFTLPVTAMLRFSLLDISLRHTLPLLPCHTLTLFIEALMRCWLLRDTR